MPGSPAVATSPTARAESFAGRSTASVGLVDGEQLRAALAPVRRQSLELHATPASATEVAAALDISRQRANYHVRALEAAGLVALVEERQRRGCVERVMRATAASFVVDPTVLAAALDDAVAAQDRFAAERLLSVAGETVRDVAGLQAAADARDERLVTFTIEAEVAFARPADLEHFIDALEDAVRTTARAFHDPAGRRYRVIAGGHPARARSADDPLTDDPRPDDPTDPDRGGQP